MTTNDATNYVILFRTYEIRDEIMHFHFRTKVSDLHGAKNENRFDDYLALFSYYLQVESEFSVLMPNRLPRIIVLKHCRSDAQGVQSSYYANGQDATQKCPASQMSQFHWANRSIP